MTTSAEIATLVEQVEPADEAEATHRTDVVAWLRSTPDVFRRVAPRTPPTHLVVYVVPRDETDGAVLLVDHRRSGLWLAAGGHVEPGEDPADTADRETAEELGVDAVFVDPDRRPAFLSVAETVGAPEDRHVDVSLWYVLTGSRRDRLSPDDREIAGTRWWTPEEVAATDPRRFDPHLGRFLTKVARSRQIT